MMLLLVAKSSLVFSLFKKRSCVCKTLAVERIYGGELIFKDASDCLLPVGPETLFQKRWTGWCKIDHQ